MYVFKSLEMLLYSKINLTNEFSLASSERTSSEVEYWPVLVFLGFLLIFIWSNKISPSCFGEEILNSAPASL